MLAGAGASKAVQPESYPTTVEFFERLPQPVIADQFFQFALSFIKEQRPDEIIDIEVVLWELQKLVEFFERINDGSSIISRAISHNVIGRVSSGWNFGQLQNGSPRLAQDLQTTIGLVNQQVYDLYSQDPEPAELAQNWSPLIHGLLEYGARLDIFTTNYDLVVENALKELNGDDFMYSYSGAAGRVQRFLDLKQWQEDAERPGGLLTKLHGSLNWKVSGQRIAIGDSGFTGTHAKHAIIYPGFKGRSNATFFEPFHDYFSRMLASADHVLIVGFAFRDEYIAQILRTSLAAATKVTILNPDKSVQFPANRKVNRVVAGFDRRAVDQFITSVRAE